MKKIKLIADLCVIGGGLSGICTAISAARSGIKVILMQDRPVLGGNASSEIRVWVRGASGKENREGGIIRELELENIYRNPTMNYSLWDSVLYDKVVSEPNITLLLNTSCFDAKCKDGKILSVRGWQLTTYTFVTVESKLFADCSGDSILAELSGADFRVGRESSAEFNEEMAVSTADNYTMGMSCLLNAEETETPSEFTPPPFANKYMHNSDFSADPSPENPQDKGKTHQINSDTNFWWIEKGGNRDSIHDTEEIRHELQKTVYGIWDHIKNQGDHGAESYELEWAGALPGKRESRRYIGDYVLTANDLINGKTFSDAVAYGGWTMDNHDPLGIDAPGYTSVHYTVNSPYQIPYRCLYSRNIENLFFAGRNISATHMALSSTRVMATCSVLGQAVGSAAAICIKNNLKPRELKDEFIDELQQTLIRDECYIPGVYRKKSDIDYILNTDESTRERLTQGKERPDKYNENYNILNKGQMLVYNLHNPSQNLFIRLVFDPDYSRQSISPYDKYRLFAMRAIKYKDRTPLKVPSTLVKSFIVTDSYGNVIHKVDNNHSSLVLIKLPDGIKSFNIQFIDTWGCENIRLFSCDIIR